MRGAKRFTLAAVCGLVLSLAVAAGAQAGVIFVGHPGTAAAPATLGGYAMTAFPADTNGLGSTVSTAPGPTGDVGFSVALWHGNNRADAWGHGYNGDFYVTEGDHAVTLTLPAHTVAFYLYALANYYTVDSVITATAQDGTMSGPVQIPGSSGAHYFGFYATGGDALTAITVSSGGDIAVGEFGISTDSTPPVVTPVVTGTMDSWGRYTSDVLVHWTVSDPDSTVTSTSGSDDTSITTDTTGILLTCSATSAGGTTESSVLIVRLAAPEQWQLPGGLAGLTGTGAVYVLGQDQLWHSIDSATFAALGYDWNTVSWFGTLPGSTGDPIPHQVLPAAAVPRAPESATVVVPVIGKGLTTPGTVLAGHKVVVSFPVTDADTGATVTAVTMFSSNPKIGNTIVKHVEKFVGGYATVTLKVPKTATGKSLKVGLTIMTGDQSASKTATFRIH